LQIWKKKVKERVEEEANSKIVISVFVDKRLYQPTSRFTDKNKLRRNKKRVKPYFL